MFIFLFLQDYVHLSVTITFPKGTVLSFQWGLICLEKGKFHACLNALLLNLKTSNFFAGMAKPEWGILSRWSPNRPKTKLPPFHTLKHISHFPEIERTELIVTSSIISTNPNFGLRSLIETRKGFSHYQTKYLSKFVPTQEKSQREDPGPAGYVSDDPKTQEWWTRESEWRQWKKPTSGSFMTRVLTGQGSSGPWNMLSSTQLPRTNSSMYKF